MLLGGSILLYNEELMSEIEEKIVLYDQFSQNFFHLFKKYNVSNNLDCI